MKVPLTILITHLIIVRYKMEEKEGSMYKELLEVCCPTLLHLVGLFFQDDSKIVSARDAAKAINVSLRKTQRALAIMVEYGVIESVKGRYGGYRLVCR